MKRTLIIALLFSSFSLHAQWHKDTNGQLTPNDTTITVRSKRFVADSAWTTRVPIYMPPMTETATGSNYMAAAYNNNWWAFSVQTTIRIDSVGWALWSANASTDSFRVGIFQWSDSTRLGYADWGTHGGTANNTIFYQALNTPVVCVPGRVYVFMYSMNTNTTLPVTDIMNNGRFYYDLKRRGMMGTITGGAGQAFPSSLSGSSSFAPANVPMFALISAGTLQ